MAPDPEGLEDWMENLMGILLEVFGRLDDQREVVASVNHSTKRKDETQEALYTQIEKLQSKIHDLQLKEQDYLRRLQLCGKILLLLHCPFSHLQRHLNRAT